MKIAMMTNNYKPFIGGVPISVERLAKGLRALGHEVCIFAPEYEGEEELEEDVVRYRSHKRKLSNGMVFPSMFDPCIRQEFEMREFDLIHVHQPMVMGNVAKLYSKRYGIPLVFTWHTRYEEYLHYLRPFANLNEETKGKREIYHMCQKAVTWYMKAYARDCDFVFAPSRDMEWYMEREDVGVPVMTLPTGLSHSSFEKEKEVSEKVRTKFKGEKKYLFCTVSRIEKEKNLYFLMDAVRRFQDKCGNVFRLLVVGEGGERKNLMDYCKRIGLEDTVVFVGGVPNEEVKNYLFASDLFLFSSRSETQGIVLAEAMAAGLPVVALEAYGVNDIVRNGYNGLLCEESVKAFTENVETMLKDRSLYEKLKEGAAETANSYREEAIAKEAEKGYLLAQKYAMERGNICGHETCESEDLKPSFLRVSKMS